MKNQNHFYSYKTVRGCPVLKNPYEQSVIASKKWSNPDTKSLRITPDIFFYFFSWKSKKEFILENRLDAVLCSYQYQLLIFIDQSGKMIAIPETPILKINKSWFFPYFLKSKINIIHEKLLEAWINTARGSEFQE